MAYIEDPRFTVKMFLQKILQKKKKKKIVRHKTTKRLAIHFHNHFLHHDLASKGSIIVKHIERGEMDCT